MQNLGPNIQELKTLVESKEVNAVIYTHLHGYKADLKSLSEICKKNNFAIFPNKKMRNTTGST